MFVESLVESTPLLRTGNRMPALVSLVVQSVAVAILVIIPILHPEILRIVPEHLSTLAPPPTPAPPPPVQRVRTVATNVRSVPVVPAQIPDNVRNTFHGESNAVENPLIAIDTTMGSHNPALPTGLDPTAPNVVARRLTTERIGPVRISQGVTAGLLLAPIQPIYPQIAKTIGAQGTVVVEAVISKTGRIESAHAVSGPAVLQTAALDAVRAARYRPYLLNGEPCEVETTVNINFRMN